MLMIILAAAAVAAEPAPAADAPQKPVSSVTVEAKAKAKDDKVVCFREASTGSHRTQKVCRRKGDMETQDDLLRDRIRERPDPVGGIGGGPR